jgi:hypothetical protein
MANLAFNTNLKGYRTIVGDFSRSFMFRITVPSWYGGDNLSMLARSVTLPAYTLKTSKIAFQGLQLNVATVPEFDQSFTVKMLADEKQVLRGNIMKWMSYIYDPSTMEAAPLSGPNEYKRDDVVVQQLDRMGKTIMAYKFYGLFPQKIDSPELNHETVDPQTFSVTFNYDFFTYIVKEPGQLASGEGNEVGGGNDKVGFVNSTPGKAGAGTDGPKQSTNKPPAA